MPYRNWTCLRQGSGAREKDPAPAPARHHRAGIRNLQVLGESFPGHGRSGRVYDCPRPGWFPTVCRAREDVSMATLSKKL